MSKNSKKSRALTLWLRECKKRVIEEANRQNLGGRLMASQAELLAYGCTELYVETKPFPGPFQRLPFDFDLVIPPKNYLT